MTPENIEARWRRKLDRFQKSMSVVNNANSDAADRLREKLTADCLRRELDELETMLTA
jgi:hypothetical protein